MADPRILREIRSHAEETTVMCWSAGFSSTDAAARWAAEHGSKIIEALGRLCNLPQNCDHTECAEDWSFARAALSKASAFQSPKGGG